MSPSSAAEPAKGIWERTRMVVARIILATLAAAGAAMSALWPVFGWVAPGLRIALGILVAVSAVMAAVLQGAEVVAKSRREKRVFSSIERLRRDYNIEFASLFGSLSNALDRPGDRGQLEGFIGQSAEKFLALVGNEDRCLRVAIYRMDGREDDDTPEDDYRLERIGTAPHGRSDLPRYEFKYNDPAERAVIRSLESRDIIKWPDLTEDYPVGHDPSRKYKAFYTMPVVSPGNRIKGMVTCDSTEVGVLGDRHEQSMRMITHLVSVGLTLMPKKVRMKLEDEGAEGESR